MAEFWSFFENGIWHIFNLFVCKHILFLIVLAVPYTSKDWKKLLVFTSIFTLGNVIALTLSVFGVIIIKGHFISFLVPLFVFLLALFNLFSGKISKALISNGLGFLTLTLGLLHGFDISNLFKSLTKTTDQTKFFSILEFSLGIEVAQIIIVPLVLLFIYICQTLFRFSKRDCILILSSFVIGVLLPSIVNNEIWKRLS